MATRMEDGVRRSDVGAKSWGGRDALRRREVPGHVAHASHPTFALLATFPAPFLLQAKTRTSSSRLSRHPSCMADASPSSLPPICFPPRPVAPVASRCVDSVATDRPPDAFPIRVARLADASMPHAQSRRPRRVSHHYLPAPVVNLWAARPFVAGAGRSTAVHCLFAVRRHALGGSARFSVHSGAFSSTLPSLPDKA